MCMYLDLLSCLRGKPETTPNILSKPRIHGQRPNAVALCRSAPNRKPAAGQLIAPARTHAHACMAKLEFVFNSSLGPYRNTSHTWIPYPKSRKSWRTRDFVVFSRYHDRYSKEMSNVSVSYSCSCKIGPPLPLDPLYVCRDCDVLACPSCVSQEIETLGCPNCFETVLPSDAGILMNRWAKIVVFFYWELRKDAPSVYYAQYVSFRFP